MQRNSSYPRSRIVIPTGAKRSGGTCGSAALSWKGFSKAHPATTPTCVTPLPLSSSRPEVEGPKRSEVEGSAVRPAALSNPSSEALADEPSPLNQAPCNLISLVAGHRTRLGNKISAARSTHPVIWTALKCERTSSRYRTSTWTILSSTRPRMIIPSTGPSSRLRSSPYLSQCFGPFNACPFNARSRGFPD